MNSSEAEQGWARGEWFNAPESVEFRDSTLIATAVQGSDFWQTTEYGFTRDSGHALLAEFEVGQAIEVSFIADMSQQFDQAGVMVRQDQCHWLKAGAEYVDGTLCFGAVSTQGMSDWSTHPEPTWLGSEVTVRVSRSADALTVRMRSGDEPWRLARLAPFRSADPCLAGPYLCAPSRAGFQARFTRLTRGDADAALHA